MTFKDLQRLVQSSESEDDKRKNIFPELQKLRGKPFWIWLSTDHRKTGINGVNVGNFTI
jgi:hypothetical protein